MKRISNTLVRAEGGATIVWFRQDLRVADNPALSAAVSRGRPVLPVFIWAPQEEGNWPPGAASRWWLHHALAALDTQLRSRGNRLWIGRGDSLSVLQKLARETGADAVLWNRRYEPAARRRDARVEAGLLRDGLKVRTFNSALLWEPWELKTRQGGPFRVFTALWKYALTLPEPPPPLPAPAKIPPPLHRPGSDSLDDLGLLPGIGWDAGFPSVWRPGEAGAADRLEAFLGSSLKNYKELRDLPAEPGTSMLSPHLHWGDIGPRQIWHGVRQAAPGRIGPPGSSGPETFLRELGWREFAYHLLYHFPDTPEEPLRPEFTAFPWKTDEKALRAWSRGRTGYPMVDAGMRQLWRIGWMHNRVRMITASFLVKDLLIPWQAGARWFWDTLVDADLANNTLGWQWTAGCGADAAPFFRIFNPVSQGQRFDPRGAYIRRWVPELADRDEQQIHQPHTSAEEGDLLPINSKSMTGPSADPSPKGAYPPPIVDHVRAREVALAAFARVVGRGG